MTIVRDSTSLYDQSGRVISRLRECDKEDTEREEAALTMMRQEGLLEEGFGDLGRRGWTRRVREILARHGVLPKKRCRRDEE